MIKRRVDIFLGIILLFVSTITLGQPTIPAPNNPPTTGTGSLATPFAICAGSTSTFYVVVNEDAEAGDISSNDFEWEVYGGTIMTAETGSFEVGPTTNLVNLQNHSVATQSNITNTAGEDRARITIQWDTNAFGNAWIAVRQTSAHGCSDGTWSLFYVSTGVLVPGAIGTNQFICDGSTPAPLTSTTNASMIGLNNLTGTNLLTNGSFETPNVATSQLFPHGNVDGWSSSIANIEIWQTGQVDGIAAYEGEQLLELNSSTTGNIFQDVTTVPGTVMKWQFAHRNRGGADDVVRLQIGPAGGTVNFNQTYTTGTTWTVYSGTYIVPDGQTSTRIRFSSVSPIGGSGNLLDAITFYNEISYQWEVSTNLVDYTAIAGATGATYAPPAQTANRFYRRRAISGFGGCEGVSNVVEVRVSNVDGGTISDDQIVCSGGDVAELTNVVAAAGAGNLTYQWQESNDNVTFTDITGATAIAYNPDVITSDKWYRRRVTSDQAGCVAFSNVVRAQVGTIDAGTIADDQTICFNTIPAAFTQATAAQGTNLLVNGSFEYPTAADGTPISSAALSGWTSELDQLKIWQSGASTPAITAHDGGQFAEMNITGIVNVIYQDVTTIPGTQMNWQIVHRGGNVNNSIRLEIGTTTAQTPVQTITTGSTWTVYTGTYTIPAGQTTTRFKIRATSGGAIGNFLDNVRFSPQVTYQWQMSTTSATAGFVNIAGATATTYTHPTTLTLDTWYRRVATTSIGNCTANSNSIKVTVNNLNISVYDVTNLNAANAVASLVVTANPGGVHCPDVINFNGNTNAYSAGLSQVVFRVDRNNKQPIAAGWSFDFTISGTGINVNSFVNVVSSDAANQPTVTGTGSVRTINVPAGATAGENDYVLITINIANSPGDVLDVIGTASAATSEGCNESGSTIDNARTHRISHMAVIGAIIGM